MPDERTVRTWAINPKHPFSGQYTHARELGFASMAEEILEIADDSRNDYVEKVTRSGGVENVVNEEAISRSKVRIAARQWLLAKALPHTFGDKIGLEHAGSIKIEEVPKPGHPGKEALDRMLAAFEDGRYRHETPEERKARKAHEEERLLEDPEVKELTALYTDLGEDEAEAQRKAKLDVILSRDFLKEKPETRRRRRIEYIRKEYGGGESEDGR